MRVEASSGSEDSLKRFGKLVVLGFRALAALFQAQDRLLGLIILYQDPSRGLLRAR